MLKKIRVHYRLILVYTYRVYRFCRPLFFGEKILLTHE